jgi:hypothetical protein
MGPDSAIYFLDHYAYYFIFALFIVCLSVYRLYWKAHSVRLGKFSNKNRFAIMVALALSIVVFFTVPIGYKVLSDEANYVGVSKSMRFHQTTQIAFGEIRSEPIYVEHAKRPLLFPFLIHLLHYGSGYRVANAFAVNFAALFAMLLLVFIQVHRKFDFLTSTSALLLILAQPILPLAATSSGAELLSSLFLLVTLVCFYNYLKDPSPEGLLLLWANSLLLIHSRYECIAYVAILFLAALITKTIRFSDVKAYRLYFFMTPFFLLPWIWQRLFKQDLSSLQRNPEGREFHAYGWDYLSKHLQELVSKAPEFLSFLPFSPLLIVLGSLATLGFAVFFLRKARSYEIADRIFLSALFLCVLANFVIFFSFSGGSVIRPSAARYFLNLCLFLSLCPLFFKNSFRIPSWGLFAFSVIAFFVYFPVAMKNEAMDSMVEIRMTKAIAQQLKKFKKEETFLFCDKPNHFTVDNFSAATFPFLRETPRVTLQQLRSMGFSQFLVAQRIDKNTGQLQKGQEFPLPLIRLEELNVSPWDNVRFSRVD